MSLYEYGASGPADVTDPTGALSMGKWVMALRRSGASGLVTGGYGFTSGGAGAYVNGRKVTGFRAGGGGGGYVNGVRVAGFMAGGAGAYVNGVRVAGFMAGWERGQECSVENPNILCRKDLRDWA